MHLTYLENIVFVSLFFLALSALFWTVWLPTKVTPRLIACVVMLVVMVAFDMVVIIGQHIPFIA